VGSGRVISKTLEGVLICDKTHIITLCIIGGMDVTGEITIGKTGGIKIRQIQNGASSILARLLV